ncbi:replication protein A1-like protein [Trifolium medium]|uniref:Replication protein A1-like protein n=1 Tax=Trifolium medium TaxID=97028 RepID=A0A392LYL8_9FABA|nr:replication protein A1-like protein [Trifolium medium]
MSEFLTMVGTFLVALIVLNNVMDPHHHFSVGINTQPIYRIDVQVFDGNDSAKFVFWDNSCIDLLGRTTSELRQQMIKLGITDPSEYPKCIDDIMGRKFAFRVNWQFDWKQCSVLACLDSKFMVDTLEAELQKLNIGGNSSLTIKDTEDSHDEIQSLSIVDNLFDPVLSITEGVSATSEHDPDEDLSITPTKIAPTTHLPEETIAAQLSSTKRTPKPIIQQNNLAAQVSSTKSAPTPAIQIQTIEEQPAYAKRGPPPSIPEEPEVSQNSSAKTPSTPSIPEETIAAQLSSTKLKKRIKKEK